MFSENKVFSFQPSSWAEPSMEQLLRCIDTLSQNHGFYLVGAAFIREYCSRIVLPSFIAA